MKKLFKNILLFLIPVIVITVTGDIVFSNVLRKDRVHAEGEYEVWNDIYSGNINAECLIYGSSRAYEHMDPLIIERKTGLSSYNLGLDGQNFYMHRLRHNEYMKHNTKPRYIIYSLEVSTLTKKDGGFNKKQYFPFMFWNRELKEYLSPLEGFSKQEFYLPLVRYMGDPELLAEIAEDILQPSIQEKPCRVKGYRGMEQEWNKDFEEAQKKYKAYPMEVDSSYVRMFDEFLEECTSENIKFIFIYTPQYIDGQKFVSNKDSILGIYRDLGNKYDIPFIDYSHDSISYNKKYFYNSSHLNKIGSQLFSNIFVDYLIDNKLLK